MSFERAVPRATVRGLWLVAGAAAFALVAALALQYLGGFAPCQLCIWERWPYLAIAVIGVAGALLRRPRLALVLILAPLAVDVALTAYHVGVELGWFALPESCVSSAPAATSIEDLRSQILAARPTCDQVRFTFLGLSLAAWSLLYLLAMLAGAAYVLARDWTSAAEQNRYRRLA